MKSFFGNYSGWKRWLKGGAIVVCVFVVVNHLLFDATRNVQALYAEKVVFALERHRKEALQSDVPKAAEIRHYVQEGTNTKQSPGSYLDNVCSLQRTNVIRDIITYLRAKTGEDLGPMPAPWIAKYRSKDSKIAGDGGAAKNAKAIRSEAN